MLKQVFNFFEPPHKLPVPVATTSAPATMQAAAATAVAATAPPTAADTAADRAFVAEAAVDALPAEQKRLRQGLAEPEGSMADNCCGTSCSDADYSKWETYLIADNVPGKRLPSHAHVAVTPCIAAAEDTSQAAFAVTASALPCTLDRGTKSI